MRSVLSSFARWATGFLSLIAVLLILARIYAPWPLDGNEVEQATTEALRWSLRNSSHDDKPLFVSIDGIDPSADVLKDISRSANGRALKPISQRANTEDKCSTQGDTLPAFACKVDDFVVAHLITMPLWHVAIVNLQTAACFEELSLIKLASWHVISRRWGCA